MRIYNPYKSQRRNNKPKPNLFFNVSHVILCQSMFLFPKASALRITTITWINRVKGVTKVNLKAWSLRFEFLLRISQIQHSLRKDKMECFEARLRNNRITWGFSPQTTTSARFRLCGAILLPPRDSSAITTSRWLSWSTSIPAEARRHFCEEWAQI